MTEELAHVDKKEFEYSPGRARRFARLYDADAKNAWVRYLATWFGAGLAPILPGTFGSLFALPPAWLLYQAFGPGGLLVAGVALFLVGIPICRAYIRANDSSDPGEVVIDEVAAMWMVIPLFAANIGAYLVGFVLFRIFDIVKPWPVSWADRRVKGGLGIMLDDVLAAGFVGLTVAVLGWWGCDAGWSLAGECRGPMATLLR